MTIFFQYIKTKMQPFPFDKKKLDDARKGYIDREKQRQENLIANAVRTAQSEIKVLNINCIRAMEHHYAATGKLDVNLSQCKNSFAIVGTAGSPQDNVVRQELRRYSEYIKFTTENVDSTRLGRTVIYNLTMIAPFEERDPGALN